MSEEIQVLDANAYAVEKQKRRTAAMEFARQHPRDPKKSIKQILQLATMDQETAAACFFSLPRDGKTITGESIRLAEIAMACWQNIEIEVAMLEPDTAGGTVTAIVEITDLENNNTFRLTEKRSILNKQGRLYSRDMQIMTAKAAASVASRNAIFKVAPKVFFLPILPDIKKAAIGPADIPLSEKRTNAVAWFKAKGVDEKRLLTTLELKKIEDIGESTLVVLAGMRTAINDGESTIEELFPLTKAEAKAKDNLGKQTSISDSITGGKK